jgi:hypothetical protein
MIERLVGHGERRDTGRDGLLLQFGDFAPTIRDSAPAA